MERQNLRKLILISSMLLFPITIYYLSPYLIVHGAMKGIITGSFIVFIAMLISSVFIARLFCGYLCPVGGIQDCAMVINAKNPKQGWRNNIKYVIWVLWIIGIIISFIFSGQELTVDFLYATDHGISISNIYSYIIYYAIVLLVFIPSVLFGKRIFCHYFCWMAPFMVIGSKFGNLLHSKSLRLDANKDACVNCHVCNNSCPMSLNVAEKVIIETMDDKECILCGACVDSCPKKAITYQVK